MTPRLSRRERAKHVDPEKLIGAVELSRRLGIDRSTLTRRIQRGSVVPLAQLDGPRGAFVFDGARYPSEDAS